LSEHCARIIAEGMGAALAGREAAPSDMPPAPALAAQ